MYHIKTDKRAEKSVELICTGLLACLEQKEFSQISISDIQRASTVSRSTFYRNFDSLDDVLALLCDRGFDEILRSGSDALNLAAFHYWYAHGRLLEAILSSDKSPRSLRTRPVLTISPPPWLMSCWGSLPHG